ncbi:sucrose nonfermenting 4-like protein isoform X2 [Camellia sinensis]|uniref:sucrose nonfermenting 4-like protein isoform X2 n=1 Tax=Camellia sinensis TaxID=4442 RepID=UPI001035E288|nr:sucrose nonfermenting 4-like protein isoform X2 [Camellia sinensis]
MFGSGVDTGHDNSGLSSPLLIPTRFVWRYGGRRVLLSGSFTRWSNHILLSPMEGCPTVFQVICSLTPGYHEYKFFVDGEWRHDEHQPFVSGNYGVVNTVFLAREPDVIPAIYTPEAPGRSSMDVDNDPFFHLEAVPRISEADIDISRQRISVFLSTHTAYELLPESGKVIALDVNLPVKQAFHILYEQGIPVAPLWDFCKGQFVGVLSALDFILILRELGNHGSNLTEEELDTHSISAWKEGKSHLNRQVDSSGRSYPRCLIHAGPYDSLKDVALKILQKKVATVPIIHSSSQDGSFPQLLHLASLSEILKCICRHFRHSSSSLPILQQPICLLPLGTWVPKIGESNGQSFAMLRPNAPLSSALSLFVQAEVSSIPIVDDNDSLLDIYCRSDITALAKDRAYAQIRLDEMSIHQALQLGQDVSPYGFFNGQRCQMCLRSDPLHKVMERLANPGVRRLVIVEAGSKRVEGIVSLSDVFRFLLG